jgi:hypothetical protein
MVMSFCEAASIGGVAEFIERGEFAEDGGPFGGVPEVIEPWVSELGESGEEECGDGVFLHAFIESIGKFLESGCAIDGEWYAGGGGDERAIGALPVELAAFAIGVESIIECDVEGGFEAEEVENSGERGGESEASAGIVFGGGAGEFEEGGLAASDIVAEGGH